jgi:cytochrome c oxidase subunit 1
LGWDFLNQIETIGSFVIAFSVLLFIVNVLVSRRHGTVSGDDPWDARTLEWTIPSPPPMYNFAEIPQVEARDDFWHRKYTEDETGHAVRLPSGAAVAVEERPAGGDGGDEHGGEGHGDGHGIHMPSPSYFPFILALGLPILGYAAVFQAVWLVPIGALVVLFGMYAWGIEPQTEP